MSDLSSLTDDEVVDRVRRLIADEGAEWVDNYEEFLAENRTFEPYWRDGVDAIRDNTVENIIFGRECMLETGRKYLKSDMDSDIIHELFSDLAIAMHHRVEQMTKKLKM